MSLIQIWWLSNEAKDDKHCTIWLYYYSHQFNFCDSLRTEFDSIKPYIYRVQRTVTFEDYRLRVDFHCCVCMKLKHGLHMIATIAAIAEKSNVQRSQRSQWSYGNHSPAIAAITAIVATTIAEIEKVLSQGSLSFTHDLSCLASILFSRERTLKLHGSGNRSTLGTIVGDESCDDHRGSCFSRESCDF